MIPSILVMVVICLVVYALYRVSSAESRKLDKQEQELLRRREESQTININDKSASHTINGQPAGRTVAATWRSAPSARAAKEYGARAAMAKGRGWYYETKADQHGHWWRLGFREEKVELSRPAPDSDQRKQLVSRLKLSNVTWPSFDYTVHNGEHFMTSWVPFSHDGKKYQRFCMETFEGNGNEDTAKQMYARLCTAASACIRFAKPTADDRTTANKQ